MYVYPAILSYLTQPGITGAVGANFAPMDRVAPLLTQRYIPGNPIYRKHTVVHYEDNDTQRMAL